MKLKSNFLKLTPIFNFMKKNFRILLFWPNLPLLGAAPSHLVILSACLKQAGFNVKLFDCTIYKSKNEVTDTEIREKLGHVPKSNMDDYFTAKEVDIYEDFVRVVEEYKPNIIGFSVIDSTIRFSYDFIKKIKDKNIPIIMGGVGTTFNYEKILKKGLVDYACIGEGEEAFVELCNKLNNKENTTNIKNIYTMQKDGIKKNPLRPLVDINTLPPPDFSIYEPFRFYKPFFGKITRMLRVDTDRGCPMQCTYCAAPLLKKMSKENGIGHYFRLKDTDLFFEETKKLIKKYNIDFIFMSSESFLSMPIKKFRVFAEKYKKEINLPFTCQARLDTPPPEKTRLAAEMGCKSASVGLEHGSEKIRMELLNKHLTNDQILKAIYEISKYDITPGINNMIGLPDETRENIFETIELNRKINKILKGKMTINVFTFLPFSGTYLRQVCIDKGYIDKDAEIEFSWLNKSILTMPSISKDEIYGLERTFVLYVLLPKSYWPDIKIAEEDNEEGEKMFNKLMKIKDDIIRKC
jgi:anaerobic magnesium-protoporphyrin IX monomethyl ester cyclase